uniref:Uncharacterized protein n=1 Tax=Arundo donax TaxID=35708 RepID=A0A0A9AZX9_ARUDO
MFLNSTSCTPLIGSYMHPGCHIVGFNYVSYFIINEFFVELQ